MTNLDIDTIKSLRQIYAVAGGTVASSASLATLLHEAPLLSMSVAVLKSSGIAYRLADIEGFGTYLVCRYRRTQAWIPVFAAASAAAYAPKTISAEQLAALRTFATANGAQWKSKLNVAWMTGRYNDYNGTEEYGLLQQVRNTFGPSWLVKFSFDNPKTHSAKEKA
jgi:hypothetical protein